MTRRGKQKIVYVVWLSLFLLLGFASWRLQAGIVLVLTYMLISILFYWIYAFSVKCPNCRMPVLLKQHTFLGAEFYTWSLLTPGKCRHCGHPLA